MTIPVTLTLSLSLRVTLTESHRSLLLAGDAQLRGAVRGDNVVHGPKNTIGTGMIPQKDHQTAVGVLLH